MKNKLKLSYDSRKNILDKVQYYGLTGLGWILRGLTRILFGAETWRGFSALSATEWVRESVRYSLPYSTIKGIDQALKENLPPEEALDRLARKAGISKKEISASKLADSVTLASVGIRHVPLGKDIIPDIAKTDEEIIANVKALEVAIAASIKKS